MSEARGRSGPVPVDTEAFKRTFRHHPAGVAVIAADAGDGPAGLTASSVTPVSADPPLLVFSLAGSSSAAETILSAPSVTVHLLTVADVAVAVRFATRGADRFADPSGWTRLPTGEPLLHTAGARLRAQPVTRTGTGGSTLVVAAILDVRPPREPLPPLVYHDRDWRLLGPAVGADGDAAAGGGCRCREPLAAVPHWTEQPVGADLGVAAAGAIPAARPH